jgi:undecaprenyl diphosphate synthase
MAYAVLYFTETLWPDFRKENLFEAIYEYQKRERRFGKTSEQVK